MNPVDKEGCYKEITGHRAIQRPTHWKIILSKLFPGSASDHRLHRHWHQFGRLKILELISRHKMFKNIDNKLWHKSYQNVMVTIWVFDYHRVYKYAI